MNGRETRRSAKDIATAMGRLAVQNRRTIIVAVCAIVFVALLEDVLAGDLARIDQAAYVLVVEGLRAEWLTPLMEAFSTLTNFLPLYSRTFVMTKSSIGLYRNSTSMFLRLNSS